MRNTSPWTHDKQGIRQKLQRVWDRLGPARARVQDSWRSLTSPYNLLFVAVAMGCLIIFATQGVIGIGIVLVVLLFLLWKLPKRKAASLTSGWKEQFDTENETRKTWATIVGGMTLLVSFWFTWLNLRVTQDLTRQGQITDRSTKAIAQLGEEKPENMMLRIGGIYALEQVARISEDEHWPIMKILTAYLRKNCPRLPTEAPLEAAEAPRPRTYATDIEAVLTVLKRRKSEREKDGQCLSLRPVDPSQASRKKEGQCLNLRSTNLNYANLQNADLQRAQFASAHLKKAYFSNAKLQRADFYGAKLEGARFIDAKLEEVSFWRADLRGADFSRATLIKADLREAVLQNADLRGANFSGATLEDANLQKALLRGALNLEPEQLANVETLYQADLDPSLKEKIKQKDPQLLSAPAVPQPAPPTNDDPTITSVHASAEAKEKITVRGKISQWQREWHLWLAVEKENLIWPKDPEVPVTGPNSEWAVTVYEEGTHPDSELTLVLYLVEDEGHQWIRDWLSIGNATGTFPGLIKIPGRRLSGEQKLRMPSAYDKPRPDFLDRCAK
jgi:uncharacterized protein YjbI with pentapeptide repeats